jgi:SH3 domain protein
VKAPAALLPALPALLAATAGAATAYVSDDLVLGVYAEQNSQGQRLATLHSGARVETLASSGEYTQVRLGDGTLGWVKTSFLMAREPASVRVKQLEEELDRSRATTPALAEAAARSELMRIKQELAERESELAALRAQPPAAGAASGSAPAHDGLARPVRLWIPVLAAAAALAGGFGLGYATLARRIRQKFGGFKVY